MSQSISLTSCLLVLFATGCAAALDEGTLQTSDTQQLTWTPVLPGAASDGVRNTIVGPALSRTHDAISIASWNESLTVDANLGSASPRTDRVAFAEIASNVASVEWGKGRQDVFALSSNGRLAHSWNESAWSQWEELGGSFQPTAEGWAQVAATSWEPERLDVFSERLAADGSASALYHRWFERRWGRWESLGGSLSRRGLTASSGSGYTLDVFAVWTDGDVHWKRYDGHWRDWVSIGAPFGGVNGSSSAGANLLASARDAAGRAVVFTYDANGDLYQRAAPFTSDWLLVDSSRATAPGGLGAVRHGDAIELVGWNAGRSLMRARIVE